MSIVATLIRLRRLVAQAEMRNAQTSVVTVGIKDLSELIEQYDRLKPAVNTSRQLETVE